jgi:hypothetical protein
MCFTLHITTSNMKVHMQGGLSTEGEHSSMVEDAPATIEHGSRRRVMGTVRGTVLGRGLEHLDQSDPLPWEIWARPIRFMQR